MPTTGSPASWNVSGNWSTNPTVPNAAGTVVNINSNITGAYTINLNSFSPTVGILNIGDTNGTHAFTLANGTGGTLTFDNSGSPGEINALATGTTNIISATLATAGNLEINNAGAGTLTLSGALSSSTAGAKTITFGNDANGNITKSTTGISDGSGTVSVVKEGAGTLTFSIANSYTGDTTVNGGVLAISVANALSDSTDVIINSGGTISYSGTSGDTVASLTIDGGTILTASGSGTLTSTATIDLRSSSSAITRSLGGANGLNKTTGGTATLGAANTYTGNTTVSDGVLRATTSAAALGAGASQLLLTGGDLELAHTAALAFNRNTTVSADTQITTERVSGGAGVAMTLGTLSIGANELTVVGTLATSGAQGLTFGATTLSGNASFNIDNNTSGAATLLTLGAITGGGNSVTLKGDGNFAQAGAFGGSGSALILDSTYTGVAALNQANTFDGGIAIRSGVLSSGLAGALSTSGAITLGHTSGSTSAELRYLSTGHTSTNVTGITVNSGSSGAKTISTAAGNSYVNNAPILLNDALAISLNASGSGSSLNLGGAITGAGAITISGNATGTLTLSNAGGNAYTGLTTLNNGTLVVSGANGLGTAASGTVISSGTTLDVRADIGTEGLTVGGAGATAAVGALGTSTGTGTVGGTVTLSADTSFGGNGTLNLNGVITDGASSFGLTKVGTGTTTLANANTYDGVTAITAGTLAVTNASALGSNVGNTTIATGSTLDVRTNIGSEAISSAGTITSTVTDGTIGGLVTLTGNTNLNPAAGRTLTLNGGIDGAFTITKSNTTGILVLGGTGNQDGAITVNGGTLSFDSIGNVGGPNTALGAPTTAANGQINVGSAAITGTLLYTGSGHSSDRVINLTGTSGGAFLDASGSGAITYSGDMTAANSSTKTVTFTGNNAGDNTYSGDLPNTGGLLNVSKTGTGRWILSGDNLNVGTITQQANSGTLRLSGTNNNVTQVNVLTGSTLELVGGNAIGDTQALRMQNGTPTVDLMGFTEEVGAVINITGTLKSTGGTGTLLLNTGNFQGGSGTNAFTIESSAVLAGTAGWTAQGVTMDVYSNNTYTGATTITTGVFNAHAANALGSTAAGTTVYELIGPQPTTWGTLNVLTTLAAEALTVSGHGYVGNGALISNGTGEVTGTVTWATAVAETGDTWFGGSGDLTLSGVIGNNVGASNIVRIGTTGITRFTNDNNTYDVRTQIAQGTLEITSIGNVGGGNSALGAPASVANGTILFGSGTDTGTLRYIGSGHSSDRVLFFEGTTGGMALDASGSGALVFTSDLDGYSDGLPNTLTLTGSSMDANTISGLVNNIASVDQVNISKTGTGTWVLSGNNGYSGTTTITDGILLVNGNQSGATGNVTVAAGATLGGSGTIGGLTIISGIHSPGNSPGVQTFSNTLNYENGSSVAWELIGNTLASRGTNFDGVNANSALAFNGATTMTLAFNSAGSGVNWTNAFWDTSYLGNSGWLVYDVAGSTTNFSNLSLALQSYLDSSSASLAALRPGASFSLVQSGGDIYLNYNAAQLVPEPSTLALLGFSGIWFFWFARQRRRTIG